MTGVLAPQEQFTTLMGGHSLAGTPAPHGAAWWARIHAKALSMPTRAAVVEITMIRAPRATPPTSVPSGNW